MPELTDQINNEDETRRDEKNVATIVGDEITSPEIPVSNLSTCPERADQIRSEQNVLRRRLIGGVELNW